MRPKKLITSLLVCSSLLLCTACGDKSKPSDFSSAPVSGVASAVVSEPAAPTDSPEVPEEPPKADSFCFSAKSGFYDNQLDLQILCPDANAAIYYTTDGSKPSKSSTPYKLGDKLTLTDATSNPNVFSAIRGVNASEDFIPRNNVLKANVIRAVAYYSDGTESEVLNGTYFVGIDRKGKFGETPVISLMTDRENLFDNEIGIYVLGKKHDEWLAEDSNNRWKDGWQHVGNYSQKGREWEREANITFIENGGDIGFTSDVGIRIMGAASRGSMQKSFKIFFREDYGTKKLKYELIPENMREDGTELVSTYKSFAIRNGGNDCDSCKLRDPLLQDLISNRSFDTQKSTPAVVFLNGEYWGMYAINELYSDNYVENNYGIDNKNVVIIKRNEVEEGEPEDKDLYREMRDFISKNDMSDPANYAKACEMLDVVNYAEYCAFNLYIYNQDSYFKENNWEMWRVREADGATPWSDGKWRMMCYDTEYSTGIYDGGGNYRHNSIKEALKMDNKTTNILKSLLANDEFRALFINTLCDMSNIDFESARAREHLVKWDVLYKKLVPDTLERFGPQWIFYTNTSDYYSSKVGELRNFLVNRPDEFIKHIKDSFECEDAVAVTVSSKDYSKGSFTLNTSKLSFSSDYTGRYYKEAPITVNACPADGQTFDHWEVTGGRIDNANSPTAVITLDGDCSVTAIYK